MTGRISTGHLLCHPIVKTYVYLVLNYVEPKSLHHKFWIVILLISPIFICMITLEQSFKFWLTILRKNKLQSFYHSQQILIGAIYLVRKSLYQNLKGCATSIIKSTRLPVSFTLRYVMLQHSNRGSLFEAFHWLSGHVHSVHIFTLFIIRLSQWSCHVKDQGHYKFG